MRRRRAAYTAYAIGSGIFLVAAVLRGSPLLIAGSALFLVGTLLFLLPELTRDLPGVSGRRTGPRDRAGVG
ncbi:hypothetical protein [Blastococcus sp. PRF04-17]|uniref:hypothetical protein n=1 Tax=Blastococcus sp. PRF04-17 TaxID=2933797 RepID=UPI001FF4E7D6|nr:hypothetical protein [Blastococcus sp. PRF04-17]UOY01326.1 hypothetical protein MVA48_20645 [Blastococcus sp. PRF04-17]